MFVGYRSIFRRCTILRDYKALGYNVDVDEEIDSALFSIPFSCRLSLFRGKNNESLVSQRGHRSVRDIYSLQLTLLPSTCSLTLSESLPVSSRDAESSAPIPLKPLHQIPPLSSLFKFTQFTLSLSGFPPHAGSSYIG